MFEAIYLRTRKSGRIWHLKETDDLTLDIGRTTASDLLTKKLKMFAKYFEVT